MDKAPTVMNPSLIDKPLPVEDTALVDAVKACQVNRTIPIFVEMERTNEKVLGVTIFPILFDSSTREIENRGPGRMIAHSCSRIDYISSISWATPQKSGTVAVEFEQFGR